MCGPTARLIAIRFALSNSLDVGVQAVGAVLARSTVRHYRTCPRLPRHQRIWHAPPAPCIPRQTRRCSGSRRCPVKSESYGRRSQQPTDDHHQPTTQAETAFAPRSRHGENRCQSKCDSWAWANGLRIVSRSTCFAGYLPKRSSASPLALPPFDLSSSEVLSDEPLRRRAAGIVRTATLMIVVLVTPVAAPSVDRRRRGLRPHPCSGGKIRRPNSSCGHDRAAAASASARTEIKARIDSTDSAHVRKNSAGVWAYRIQFSRRRLILR